MCIPRRLEPAALQASAFLQLRPAAEYSVHQPTDAETARLSDRPPVRSRPPRLRVFEFLGALARDRSRSARNSDRRAMAAFFFRRQILQFAGRTHARSHR